MLPFFSPWLATHRSDGLGDVVLLIAADSVRMRRGGEEVEGEK
jgi:hypothetical protein